MKGLNTSGCMRGFCLNWIYFCKEFDPVVLLLLIALSLCQVRNVTWRKKITFILLFLTRFDPAMTGKVEVLVSEENNTDSRWLLCTQVFKDCAGMKFFEGTSNKIHPFVSWNDTPISESCREGGLGVSNETTVKGAKGD